MSILNPRNVFYTTFLLICGCTTGIMLKVWATGGDLFDGAIGGIVVGTIVGPLVWFTMLKYYAS